MADSLEHGEAVLLRSVYRERVRWAVPHRYVATDDGRLVLFRGVGAEGKSMGREPDGRYMMRWVGSEEPHDLVWSHTNVLQLVRPGDSHTVEVFWDATWSLLGWYVNLQAPLRRTELGFDATDWALDVWIEPDGCWEWKDEDDFAEAIALGVFDADGAETVRNVGGRVIAARPWPTGWEEWRPPSTWEPLALPSGWATVGLGAVGRPGT